MTARTAIMVACKPEERQTARMIEFLFITENAYTKEEFLEAECHLLVSIDFNVHRLTSCIFIHRYARVSLSLISMLFETFSSHLLIFMK